MPVASSRFLISVHKTSSQKDESRHPSQDTQPINVWCIYLTFPIMALIFTPIKTWPSVVPVTWIGGSNHDQKHFNHSSAGIQTPQYAIVTTNKTIQRNALKKHENHTSSSQSKEGHNRIFYFYLKWSLGDPWRYAIGGSMCSCLNITTTNKKVLQHHHHHQNKITKPGCLGYGNNMTMFQ